MKHRRLKMTSAKVTAEQKLKEEVSALTADCVKTIAHESKRLSYHLSLIHDLIQWGGMNQWMTIWSVRNHLTDGIELKKLTENTDPTSKFYKNRDAAETLVVGLKHWLAEEVIDNSTTLKKADEILSARLQENFSLLKI
jgi:hypothetical protein